MAIAQQEPISCAATLLKLGKRLTVVGLSIADRNGDLIAQGSLILFHSAAGLI